MDEHGSKTKDEKKLNMLNDDSYDEGKETDDDNSIGGNTSSFLNPKRRNN